MSEPDMRDQIASAIAFGCRRWFSKPVDASQGRTTSDCPVVIVTVDGVAYNITITKARKS